MSDVQLKGIRKIYPYHSKAEREQANKPGEASGLKTTPEGVIAVQDFNLDIKDREFIVLVGPSGCGKSTTLRMIAGLEEISDGELYIDGELMNDVPPKDRNIAMVFQSYALYPHMTVYENMAFGLQLRRESKEEIDRKVREAADILDITQYLDRKPKALSGGQRQRVAIGRAIVRNPKVFLMDEPLSNLDAKLRNQMRAEIIKLRQRIQTTFVYVTHDQTEAMTLGDRIVIMKDGFIQQIGTPQEVFDQPHNIFVAGFIGSPQMNFFEGRLEVQDGRFVVRYGDIIFPLGDDIQAALRARQQGEGDIDFGVRPNHMMLCAPEAIQPHVRTQVDVSEMMGSEIHLHVQGLAQEDVVLVIQAIDLPKGKRSGFQHGDEVCFTFGDEVIHLFDKETGKNLIYQEEA